MKHVIKIVALRLLLYEKPKNLASENSANKISTGYVMIPKVPTIPAPSGKMLCMHAKMNVKQNTTKQTSQTIFPLVSEKELFLRFSKIISLFCFRNEFVKVNINVMTKINNNHLVKV